MAIIFLFEGTVDEYRFQDHNIEVPRQDCKSCSLQMTFWSGYYRCIRVGSKDSKLWIKRAFCKSCNKTEALLPSFILPYRLDEIETVGKVLEDVGQGVSGIRPAALKVNVPYATARGWVRSFSSHSKELCASFASLTIELKGPVINYVDSYRRYALETFKQAWIQACNLPGWHRINMWHFVSIIIGGKLLANNIDSPYLKIGKRSLIFPVP